MAMGMLVVPTWKRLMKRLDAGHEVAEGHAHRPWPGRSRASGIDPAVTVLWTPGSVELAHSEDAFRHGTVCSSAGNAARYRLGSGLDHLDHLGLFGHATAASPLLVDDDCGRAHHAVGHDVSNVGDFADLGIEVEFLHGFGDHGLGFLAVGASCAQDFDFHVVSPGMLNDDVRIWRSDCHADVHD